MVDRQANFKVKICIVFVGPAIDATTMPANSTIMRMHASIITRPLSRPCYATPPRLAIADVKDATPLHE
jgi:hypothetical protein